MQLKNCSVNRYFLAHRTQNVTRINYDLEMTSFDLLKYHPDLPQITVVQVLSGNAHDDAFKLETQMQHFPLSYIMRPFLSLSSYCNSTLSK